MNVNAASPLDGAKWESILLLTLRCGGARIQGCTGASLQLDTHRWCLGESVQLGACRRLVGTLSSVPAQLGSALPRLDSRASRRRAVSTAMKKTTHVAPMAGQKVMFMRPVCSSSSMAPVPWRA